MPQPRKLPTIGTGVGSQGRPRANNELREATHVQSETSTCGVPNDHEKQIANTRTTITIALAIVSAFSSLAYNQLAVQSDHQAPRRRAIKSPAQAMERTILEP